MTQKTFAPKGQATVNIAVTTSSARVALDQFSNAVRARMIGGNDVFFEFGDSTVVATVAGSMSMASGATETFTKGAATHVAAITSAGTATAYFTSGEGL